MNRCEFKQIFSGDSGTWEGDNALQGLKIIEKYLPGEGIRGADHDIIHSVDVDELIEAGITKEDVLELCRLNWMIEGDSYLACFV